MDARRYGSLVKRWLWLLVVAPLVAGGAAYAAGSLITPRYEAKATLLVNQAQTQSLSGPNYYDVLTNQQLTRTYADMAVSIPVLEQAGRNVGLGYKDVEKMVEAKARKDTQLIDITVTDTDPETAAKLANEVARSLADQIRQAQLERQSAARDDLVKQLAAVQVSLEEKLEQQRRLSGTPSGVPDGERQARLSQLQIDIDSLRVQQSTIGNRLQDLRLEAARTPTSIALVDPAQAPVRPSSPGPLVFAALGVVLGLLLAAAFVVVVEFLDDTVKTADDVDAVVGAGLLGSIPRFGPRRSSKAPLLADEQLLQSPVGDAYELARTNLAYARAAGPENGSVLITSATAGEGKSTTAANLAVVLAHSGKRVVLVDADMREPSLHKTFDLPDNKQGLSTLFVKHIDAHDLLVPSGVAQLSVLPSGPRPPNPAGLLSSNRMTTIVDQLRQDADIVIYDAPPLLGVADTVALAGQVDGVVLVVDSTRTRRGPLAEAVERLERTNTALWGVVLNKLSPQLLRTYRRYGGVPRRPDAGAEAGVPVWGTVSGQPSAESRS